MSDTERMALLVQMREVRRWLMCDAAEPRYDPVVVVDAAIRALAVPEQAPETPDALAEFTAYFVKNYPADTIICNPEWHAPRIFRAAQYAMRAAPAALPDGKDAERDALIAEFVRWWLDDEMDGAAYFNNVMRASPAAAKAMAAAIQAQTEGERHE